MNTVIITVQAKNVKTYSETFYNNTGNLSHFLLAIVNIFRQDMLRRSCKQRSILYPICCKSLYVLTFIS